MFHFITHWFKKPVTTPPAEEVHYTSADFTPEMLQEITSRVVRDRVIAMKPVMDKAMNDCYISMRRTIYQAAHEGMYKCEYQSFDISKAMVDCGIKNYIYDNVIDTPYARRAYGLYREAFEEIVKKVSSDVGVKNYTTQTRSGGDPFSVQFNWELV